MIKKILSSEEFKFIFGFFVLVFGIPVFLKLLNEWIEFVFKF